jgi:hypothetical protein
MNVFPNVLIIALSMSIISVPASSSEENSSALGRAQVENPEAFKAAFTRLKRLEGIWDEEPWGEDEEHARVVRYRLTGKGSALIEEFIGDPAMTTVYHLDGDDLRMTHYCNAGNQPRMKAAIYESNILKFEFVDVTNLSSPNAYHTRTLDIVFHDDDHVDLRFVGLKNGEDVPGTVSLTRRSTSVPDR